MYFSTFSSSEYYSDEDIDSNLLAKEDEICLICWLPEEDKNQIKILSDFKHIKLTCKCKPKLHTRCINEWIQKTTSCPICRTKINIIVFSANDNNILHNCYSTCIVYFFRIIYYISFIHFLFMFYYNIYYIYFITNNYHEDDYGVY